MKKPKISYFPETKKVQVLEDSRIVLALSVIRDSEAKEKMTGLINQNP